MKMTVGRGREVKIATNDFMKKEGSMLNPSCCIHLPATRMPKAFFFNDVILPLPIPK